MNRYESARDRESLDRLLARQAVSLWSAHQPDEPEPARAAALWSVFASSIADYVERAEQLEGERQRDLAASMARHPAGRALAPRALCGATFTASPDLPHACVLPARHSGSHEWTALPGSHEWSCLP